MTARPGPEGLPDARPAILPGYVHVPHAQDPERFPATVLPFLAEEPALPPESTTVGA
ncbi:hypothetical protein [Methylobacterium aerolatum]|uniref:Alpha/beta hydrolase n=1 Tax=Methylobacterium aerolatum TaxID=418708 RepID=A0ABU0I489_9HYPH|nr:hypothetical protein [Methylobacterium aerolatum]MDQ0449433.1 hypothetical protein [Methylobacterium aerolatum]GJD37398.1 hypothetical protein FMGBMHLM_4328 [Methylobacterium aerolatum]